MKIMDRYILREVVHSLVYCIMAFIFLYVIADLFTYIDEMIRNRIIIETVLIYYGTFIPTIFVQIAPMAVLLATIYTLSNLKKSNELTAMRVSGVSLWRILRPLFFASALISILVFIVNDRIVPELMPISNEIREEKIKEIGEKKDTEIKNIAIFGEDNRIIYARSFDITNNKLADIIIHQNDKNQNLVMKLSAEKGYWEKGRWVFENGTTYRLNKVGYIIGSPSTFRKKVMYLKEGPKDFIKKGKYPEFMNYKQLKTYIERFSVKTSSTTRKLLVDLYYKTSLPLISLVVIFVAAPFSFMMQRGGLLIGLGISILIGLVFYGIQAVCLAMGKAGVLPPPLSAWLANILFLTLGLYLMKRCR